MHRKQHDIVLQSKCAAARQLAAHSQHRSRAAVPAAGYSAQGHTRRSSCCVWLKFWRCAASGLSQEGWTLKNPSPYGQLQLLGLSLPCSDCCEIAWLHYRWDILQQCRWKNGEKKETHSIQSNLHVVTQECILTWELHIHIHCHCHGYLGN